LALESNGQANYYFTSKFVEAKNKRIGLQVIHTGWSWDIRANPSSYYPIPLGRTLWLDRTLSLSKMARSW
jgi:hypothetical protein